MKEDERGWKIGDCHPRTRWPFNQSCSRPSGSSSSYAVSVFPPALWPFSALWLHWRSVAMLEVFYDSLANCEIVKYFQGEVRVILQAFASLIHIHLIAQSMFYAIDAVYTMVFFFVVRTLFLEKIVPNCKPNRLQASCPRHLQSYLANSHCYAAARTKAKRQW